jgi:glutamine synthetase
MVHAEYIWLDGSNPQKLRSKTKIINKPNRTQLMIQWEDGEFMFSDWNFDGSSTGQAETSKSELVLKPVNVFTDPFKHNGLLVMCEVYNLDGTPHHTNKRSILVETASKMDQETMYGFEQEYIIFDNKTGRPLGWPKEGFPKPQGDYYCAVGSNNVSGRELVYEHATMCEIAQISISGINAEVLLGQWEYQVGPVSAISGSDQLWISRYILERVAENYDCYIEYHPKPFVGNDWNGSGMHVNFSTKPMREDLSNKYNLAVEACEKLSTRVKEHIDSYGTGNELRLTGANETCSINEFRWGVADRTASIRIPNTIYDTTTPGYIEDRRPSSNCDPYVVANIMIQTVCS